MKYAKYKLAFKQYITPNMMDNLDVHHINQSAIMVCNSLTIIIGSDRRPDCKVEKIDKVRLSQF